MLPNLFLTKTGQLNTDQCNNINHRPIFFININAKIFQKINKSHLTIDKTFITTNQDLFQETQLDFIFKN